MAQTLEHNKTVVQVTPVEMPSCDADVEIIQKLDDEPNDVGGLSAQELKEKFDHVGGELKGFINEKLIPAIIADDLTEQARSAAEAERVANEMERVTNEETRAEAEEERVAAEEGREEAEQSRAAAEEARAQAEQEREDENTGIVAQAREQAEAAGESAAAAKGSEEAAALSGQEAEAAAQSAEGFAGSAEVSASAASAAASTAEDAAASAAEDAAAAKQWAERAENIAGGDFPTRQEVEENIVEHNEAQDAHEDIRQKVAGKVDKAEGTLAFALGRDAGGVYVTFEEEEDTV